MGSWLPTVAFVPLIAFLLYRRFKRTFTRQPIVAGRMWMRIGLLTLVSALLLATHPTMAGLAAALFGGAIGAGLALVALGRTQFETTERGGFYTPDKWSGLMVTALFLGRLTARIFVVYQASAAGTVPAADLQRSPFTIALYFLLAGYYVVYYLLILRRERTLAVAARRD
jgi:hypothetical protein